MTSATGTAAGDRGGRIPLLLGVTALVGMLLGCGGLVSKNTGAGSRDFVDVPAKDKDATKDKDGKGPSKGSGLTLATVRQLDAAMNKEPKMTEAEVIALVGSQPQRLGPQPIVPGINSQETLKWTQGTATLTVFISNGRLAGFKQENINR
jgi:hypothetical protein